MQCNLVRNEGECGFKCEDENAILSDDKAFVAPICSTQRVLEVPVMLIVWPVECEATNRQLVAFAGVSRRADVRPRLEGCSRRIALVDL